MVPFSFLLASLLILQTQAQPASDSPSSESSHPTATISGSISGTITGGDVVPTTGVSYISYSTTSTNPSSALVGAPQSSSALTRISSGSSLSSSPTPSLSLIGGTSAPPSNFTKPLSSGTSTLSSAAPTNTQACNNYVEFCSRKYSNITEVTAHNSMFIRQNNAASNQVLDVIAQLNDGIRMLQGQTHMVNGTLHYCHTSCDLLDAGPVQDYLSTVAGWVDAHPFDVVTILIGNGDLGPVTDFIAPIQNSGLAPYLYVPPKVPMALEDWPTLSEMILTSKRVVVFLDYNANQTAVPWILDEFSQLWETPFDPTDPAFPCTVQRPPGLSQNEAQTRMYMANHNLNVEINIAGTSLLVPNTALLNITNNVSAAGNGSLGWAASNCSSDWSRPPNFLLVDYYNEPNGTVFEVAAAMNNVTYTRQCCGMNLRSMAPALRTQSAVTVSFVVALAFMLFS
ncbi:MAG: hypothetical protein M1821_005987 [Bathelium mastoideum]|nr:MAG: hypothetical protein M1821_005987 [Bathelium mastoideum]